MYISFVQSCSFISLILWYVGGIYECRDGPVISFPLSTSFCFSCDFKFCSVSTNTLIATCCTASHSTPYLYTQYTHTSHVIVTC